MDYQYTTPYIHVINDSFYAFIILCKILLKLSRERIRHHLSLSYFKTRLRDVTERKSQLVNRVCDVMLKAKQA